MIALVLGLGSMGKRRIRILKEMSSIDEIIGYDLDADRRDSVCKEFDITEIANLDDIPQYQIDVAFVCTSPQSHEKIIEMLLGYNLNIFTEINLSNSYYDKVINLAKEKNLKLFLSSTFLYRKEIDYINQQIKDKKVNYTYHVGQYLPDWHPWESYKDYFISKKETNGCRELLAIELPWLTKVFGDIKSFYVLKQKQSSLEIDYPDSYALIFEHISGNLGTIFIDLISRPAIRELSVFGENMNLRWFGKPDSLQVYNESRWDNIMLYDEFKNNCQYAPNIIEDAYQEEVIDFISWLVGDINAPKYSFEKDNIVLDIVKKIEESL